MNVLDKLAKAAKQAQTVAVPPDVLAEVIAALTSKQTYQYTNEAKTATDVIFRIVATDGKKFDSCVIPWEQCLMLVEYLKKQEQWITELEDHKP